jgi:hypothetical protein
MSKLKEESFQYLSLLTPCWHIDDETHPFVGVNIQRPLQLERKDIHRKSIMIKIILHLSHDYHSNPTKNSNLQDQINSNGVDNDNIYQCVNTIN